VLGGCEVGEDVGILVRKLIDGLGVVPAADV